MRILTVDIDRTSPIPLYHQLAEQLSAAVRSGRLQPGDPFENELDLAERLGLSRPTVRRAIQELVNAGLLVRRRGVGTTVARRVVHRRVELTSLFDDLREDGRKPRSEILSFATDALDPPVAARLGLAPDTPLVSIERLRFAGGSPLAIMHNWLPPQYADLSQEDLKVQGLYALLRERGARPAVAKQRIGARMATSTERKLLRLDKSSPLVTMEREAFDLTGTAIELGVHCYRADDYAVEVTLYAR